MVLEASVLPAASTGAGATMKRQCTRRLQKEIEELKYQTQLALQTVEAEKAMITRSQQEEARKAAELESRVLRMRESAVGFSDTASGRDSRGSDASDPSYKGLVPSTASQGHESERGSIHSGKDEDSGARRPRRRSSFGAMFGPQVDSMMEAAEGCPESDQDTNAQRPRRRPSLDLGAMFGQLVEAESGPGPEQDTNSRRPRRRPSLDLGAMFGHVVEAECGPDSDEVRAQNEAHQEQVRDLEASLENADSSLKMMEYIHETQKARLVALQVEVVQMKAKNRCMEAKAICTGNDSATYKKALSKKFQSEMRLRDVHGKLSMILREADYKAQLAAREEEAILRHVMEAEAKERVSLMRGSMFANKLKDEVRLAETEKHKLKIMTKVKKRHSCRVVRMLLESMDDAQSVETESEVVMEVVMRGSIMRKMIAGLEKDAEAISKLEHSVKVKPQILAFSEELNSQLDDMVSTMEDRFAEWTRKASIQRELRERDEQLLKLERTLQVQNIQVIRKELDLLRRNTQTKLRASFATIEASRQELARVIKLYARQEQQYRALQNKVLSVPKDSNMGKSVWDSAERLYQQRMKSGVPPVDTSA